MNRPVMNQPQDETIVLNRPVMKRLATLYIACTQRSSNRPKCSEVKAGLHWRHWWEQRTVWRWQSWWGCC